jgi:hypothetical protein
MNYKRSNACTWYLGLLGLFTCLKSCIQKRFLDMDLSHFIWKSGKSLKDLHLSSNLTHLISCLSVISPEDGNISSSSDFFFCECETLHVYKPINPKYVRNMDSRNMYEVGIPEIPSTQRWWDWRDLYYKDQQDTLLTFSFIPINNLYMFQAGSLLIISRYDTWYMSSSQLTYDARSTKY